MKFGGTSVESAEAITRVVSIVAERLSRRPVVVVSAMGKTTNRLLQIADEAARGNRQHALELTHDLELFHVREARHLVCADDQAGIEALIREHFKDIEDLVRGLSVLGELTPRSVDAISAYGERLSSLIVTQAFRFHHITAEHVDSRELIVTDRRHTQAAPILDLTYSRIRQRIPPLVARGAVVVMGGFIAATEDGVTTTLGRGGSDFSASIIGAGIPAEEIQIWTDVDGMLTCDPRICDNGHRVRTI
ncbi:MAG TPA: lysine-sensitive aspartokinase 3, partial [Bryobacteraceae bacterium]|nr:lysine-sensitive aspartokinase 3 [Bryobacteraceae bacterium]